MAFLTQLSMLTPMQRVQRCYGELMGHTHTLAYSGVLMVGKYAVRDDIPTACTDGIDCYYNGAFVVKQDDPALRGLILHETLHKTFQHMFLWQHLFQTDPRIANQSCDYNINLIIKDLERDTHGFVRLPNGALVDERFRGMSSRQIFDLLRKEQQGQQGQPQPDEGDGTLDQHDWSRGKGLSDEEREQVSREIDQAIRQGQLAATKLSGKQPRALTELTEPKVDWREQLRDFVQSTVVGNDISTWQRVNRRWLQHDVYMPSTVDEVIGRIVIAPDMSGSTAGIVKDFMSEVQGIAMNTQPERVDILYWDTSVTKHEIYARDKLDKLIDTTCPKGGGGTTVTCVPEYMRVNQMRPECVIVLTDGEVGSNWGNWSVPVLWCIVGNKSVRPTTGTAIYLD